MRNEKLHWSKLIDKSRVESVSRPTLIEMSENRGAIDPSAITQIMSPWVYIEGFTDDGYALLRVKLAPLEEYTGREMQWRGEGSGPPRDYVFLPTAFSMMMKSCPQLFKTGS